MTHGEVGTPTVDGWGGVHPHISREGSVTPAKRSAGVGLKVEGLVFRVESPGNRMTKFAPHEALKLVA